MIIDRFTSCNFVRRSEQIESQEIRQIDEKSTRLTSQNMNKRHTKKQRLATGPIATSAKTRSHQSGNVTSSQAKANGFP